MRDHLQSYVRPVRKGITSYRARLRIAIAQIASWFHTSDVAIFHQFAPPPGGGGHQFMRALWHEFARRGLHVENNTISPTTRACLYNSFNFDFARLRAFRRNGCRMVHRVDGPIGVYRGSDDGSDQRIWQINAELANATIFQSSYSMHKHIDLGYTFAHPVVILNAADPHIFHPQGRVPFDRQRKLRLISTSWSDNPNKGAAVYQWLEEHLDWQRFEYTFVGRSPLRFARMRMLGLMDSAQLAATLRQHDIFVTASVHESCSNALIEALSCGLPALYIQSGGHAEIVGEGGIGFAAAEELPAALERLVEEYEERQQQIALPTLAEVASRYLDVMGIEA